MPNQRKTDAELSEAARAVVRDTGDPRIDAHLAALGLGPEDPAPAVAEPPASRAADAPTAHAAAAPAPQSGPQADLAAALREVQASLASEQRRARMLTVALVVAVLADVLLAARIVLG